MTAEVVDLLCDLVAIPSVNPMGRPVEGDIYFEHKVTEYLASFFERHEIPFERQRVAPLRENIFARVEGETPPEQGGPLWLWEAHQDTVPVDGMTIPPFSPQVQDGKVFGRGACDIKGGMAAMLVAFLRLHRSPRAGRPTIVMGCTVNEEFGFSGATALAELCRSGRSRLLPRPPDRVIVAEPTSLSVVVSHKGVVRWKCRARGKAAHSSQPHLGESAVYRMARVLASLEKYAQSVVGSLGNHPLLGNPTISVGLIRGGVSVNTVPDLCEIEIDRRLMPGEDPLAAQAHAREHVAKETGLAVDHDAPFTCSPGLADTLNRPLAEELAALARPWGGGKLIGVPFGTDAPAYARECPTVVFGPGSINQAHTADEWIAVEQLHHAVEVFFQFGRQIAA